MAAEDDQMDFSQLESKEQIQLLNLVDHLKSQKISRTEEIQYPQLVVCGDQSSGKSSVLNAITRLRFPAKAELCTTFATELRLRRGSKKSFTATIRPGEKRTAGQRQALENYYHTFDNANEFPDLIQDAREAMRQASMPTGFGAVAPKISDGTIFDDVLCVEITKEDVPSLTIVDLPGIIHSPNQNQNERDRDKILQLVEHYMANKRSIILAVVSTRGDLALQVVLERAERKEHDPDKVRTLGIITKPDVMEPSRHEQPPFIRLAQNKSHPLSLGWHVLRNRNDLEADSSDAERDEVEKDFFETEPWSALDSEFVGVRTLCGRLHRVLADHIRTELPKLRSDLSAKIKKYDDDLTSLGHARDGAGQQREYLIEVSTKYQTLTNAALDGHYTGHDDFFVDAKQGHGNLRKLRAVVQNLNDEFSDCMHTKGHRWQISTPDDELPPSETTADREVARATAQILPHSLDSEFPIPEQIAVDDMVSNHVNPLLSTNRGPELHGSLPASTIGKLFRDQSTMWKSIANAHLDRVFDVVEQFLNSLLAEKAQTVYDKLIEDRVNRVLDQHRANLDTKLDELMSPFTTLHPIMHSRDFIEKLEKQEGHRLTARFKEYFNLRGEDSDRQEIPITPAHVMAIFGSHGSQANSVVSFTSLKAIDMMSAYYKSALEIFICNICTLAVENCLLSQLVHIVSPKWVVGLTPDELDDFAGESQPIRQKRKMLEGKLAELREALATIDKQYRLTGAVPQRGRPSRVTRTRDPVQLPGSQPKEQQEVSSLGPASLGKATGSSVLASSAKPSSSNAIFQFQAPLPAPVSTPPAAKPESPPAIFPSKAETPKRGLSAYMHFANDMRETVREENPGIRFGDVGKLLGQKWNGLTNHQRARYEAMAAADRKRYDAEIASSTAAAPSVRHQKEQLPEATAAATGSPSANFSNPTRMAEGVVVGRADKSTDIFSAISKRNDTARSVLPFTASALNEPMDPPQLASATQLSSRKKATPRPGRLKSSAPTSPSPISIPPQAEIPQIHTSSSTGPPPRPPSMKKIRVKLPPAASEADAQKPANKPPVQPTATKGGLVSIQSLAAHHDRDRYPRTCELTGLTCEILEPIAEVDGPIYSTVNKALYLSINAYGTDAHKRLSFEELRLSDYECGSRYCWDSNVRDGDAYDPEHLLRQIFINFPLMSADTRRFLLVMLAKTEHELPPSDARIDHSRSQQSWITGRLDIPHSKIAKQVSRLMETVAALYEGANDASLEPSLDSQRRTLRILRNEELDTWEEEDEVEKTGEDAEDEATDETEGALRKDQDHERENDFEVTRAVK